jgi:REP element-mobilizing transposase RayT
MHRLPKRKTIRLEHNIYVGKNIFFVTMTTSKRHRWFQLYPELSKNLISYLGQIADLRQTALYAWCLMPDHLHMLIGDESLIDFVRLLKGKLTPKARRIDPTLRLWQRSFYDHALRKEEDINATARYIWENPVRDGLVSLATQYPFSGSNVWTNWREIIGRG